MLLTIQYTTYHTTVTLRANLQSTSRSSCTSCDGLKKRIKGLQKTISWYEKTKATLQKKIHMLEAGTTSTSVPSTPTFSTAVLDSDEDSEEEIHSENESLMDYSSLEESSQSAAEMDEDTTRNTVRYAWYVNFVLKKFICVCL